MIAKIHGMRILSILGLALTACSDIEDPELRPRLSVRISPEEVPALCEGSQTQLQASVFNAIGSRVNWRTSAPMVATVDSTGKVTGKTAGSAIITAIAAADTLACDTVTVTVAPVVFFYDVITISIGTISKHNTQTPIDPVCNQGAVQAQGQTLCIVNTAERTASGQRRYPIGQTNFIAELVASNGTIVASATSLLVTLTSDGS